MFKIGIDGHNLEQPMAGVARTLIEELRGLSQISFVRQNIKFILYFKSKAPADPFFDDPVFEKKILSHIVRPSSAIFYNILLPYFTLKDKVDLCYFPCYMLPLFYRGKSIVTLHDVAYEAHPEWFPPYYRYSYHILSSRAAKKASVILTISEFSKQEIIKYYHIPPEKIWVIPLAISDLFRKIDDQAWLQKKKEKYGIKKDFIFFLSQIFTRRHAHEAMLAFQRIALEFSNLQFLVVGRDLTYPGLELDELARKINKKLSREAIIRIPYIQKECISQKTDEDLLALYNAAKLFVCPSEYEGFSLPSLEALACGTPILIAHSGASDEVFGDAAFYVENPRDIDEMADKIRLALLDDGQRKRVIQSGESRVKKFNWKAHCEKLLELFQMVLK